MPTFNQRHGLRRGWSRRDLREVRAFHGPLWEKYKFDRMGRSNGAYHRGLERIPGFKKKLRQFVKDGWGVTDIGSWFGVEPEAVRLWFRDMRIRNRCPYGSLPRIWSWEQLRYIPIPWEEMYKEIRKAKVEARDLKKDLERDHQVLVLQALAYQLKRSPTLKELSKALRVSVAYIGKCWGYPHVSYSEAFWLLYNAAGIEKRPRGWSGHRDAA